jgi:hypothetical protein
VPKIVAALCFGIVPTTVAIVAAWHIVSFVPYLNELRKLADSGEKSLGPNRTLLCRLVMTAETNAGMRNYAIKQAYFHFVAEKHSGSTLSWHVNTLLWRAGSVIHLSEREVCGIWAECALYGCGRGLREAARRHLADELQYLTDIQLAALVVMVRSPSRFAPNTKLGSERASELLKRSITH